MARTWTREQAIKALDDMWEVAFPEGSRERLQNWAEDHDLCEQWDGDEDYTDEMHPPGIWDLLIAIGVTPAELVEHVGANADLFKSPALETSAVPCPDCGHYDKTHCLHPRGWKPGESRSA